MTKSLLYSKYLIKYCKHGRLEKFEKYAWKKIVTHKKKAIFTENNFFFIFFLFKLNVYYKKKKIAKFLELIPRALHFKQIIQKTLIELKKEKIFFFDLKVFHRKEKLIKEIYKNRLNIYKW
jgi:hypothetical protein